MNATADPLAELRPLHLPADIGWWPPAPGWWLLALLLVALVTWATLAWRRRAARREALGIIRAVHKTDLAGPALAQAINLALRRYAMACYPQHNIAALSGRPWLEFLNSHGAGRDFTAATALSDAPFMREAQVDRHELIGLATHWVKHNKRRNGGS